jgi:hypothetical protein
MADAKDLNELLAPNIIDHVRIMQKAEAAMRWYFHARSKLMRAIHKHISNPNAPCVIIDRPYSIATYRGTGAAIHFKDMTVYGTQFDGNSKPYEVDFYQLKIEVEYDDEDEGYKGDKIYMIDVPIDLEINFTEEKFDAWVGELAKKRASEKEAKDREVLEALLKKYPKWANPGE